MKPCLAVVAILLVAGFLDASAEERSFRGEIVEVDLEGSLIVVASSKPGDDVELLLEIDELTTELRARIPSELAPGDEPDEPTPIALSDLEVGDYVEVRYEVVQGRNVATLVERSGAQHA